MRFTGGQDAHGRKYNAPDEQVDSRQSTVDGAALSSPHRSLSTLDRTVGRFLRTRGSIGRARVPRTLRASLDIAGAHNRKEPYWSRRHSIRRRALVCVPARARPTRRGGLRCAHRRPWPKGATRTRSQRCAARAVCVLPQEAPRARPRGGGRAARPAPLSRGGRGGHACARAPDVRSRRRGGPAARDARAGLVAHGAASRADGEVRKAARQATTPLTHARVLEAQALFAWKAEDREAALTHLAAARELYARQDSSSGLLRVLEEAAGVLRGAGRLGGGPGRCRTRRRRAPSRPPRPSGARARPQRPWRAFTAWVGGRRRAAELDDSAALGSERRATPASSRSPQAGRAVVDVAPGDLGRGRELPSTRRATSTRTAATRDAWRRLSCSSRTCTSPPGERESAERIAVEALGLYRLLGDAEGECRARVRRAHALVMLGRHPEAVREGRRALRCAAAVRAGPRRHVAARVGASAPPAGPRGSGARLRAGASAVSRRPARLRPRRSSRPRRRARRRSRQPRRAPCHRRARGLGRPPDPRLCLADMREVLGRRDRPHGRGDGGARRLRARPALAAAVDAAAAVLDEGPRRSRAGWPSCAPSGTVIPWWRAVLVGEPAGSCAWTLVAPRRLAADDWRGGHRRSAGPAACGPSARTLGQRGARAACSTA